MLKAGNPYLEEISLGGLERCFMQLGLEGKGSNAMRAVHNADGMLQNGDKTKISRLLIMWINRPHFKSVHATNLESTVSRWGWMSCALIELPPEGFVKAFETDYSTNEAGLRPQK